MAIFLDAIFGNTPQVSRNLAYCGNLAFFTYQQILIVEVDTEFCIGKQTIIEQRLNLSSVNFSKCLFNLK